MRTLSVVIVISLALCLGMQSQARADEIWKARDGGTTFHFDTDYLAALGLTLTGVNETVASPTAVQAAGIEEPQLNFMVLGNSDLRFRVANGLYVDAGLIDGALRHAGGLTLMDVASGTRADLSFYQLVAVPGTNELRARGTASPQAALDLVGGMPSFDPATGDFRIGNFDLVVTPEWAAAAGRPDLAGRVIGTGTSWAHAEFEQRAPATETPPPSIILTRGTDVLLGGIDGIIEQGRIGTYPSGVSGVSFATTSCNIGDVDVPWYAPMDTRHPAMTLAVYRDLNGRMEQIGVAWVKHGFYALSSSQCTPCQHPSPGYFLGVGCSDTYSAGNNGDRTYLGPRKEWNGYTIDWNCVGSYFSGGPTHPDCTRRVFGSGLDGTAHRIRLNDADLNNAGATYWYEGAYAVKEDVNLHNNWGYRRCTMSWTGSSWAFSTPGSGNPMVEGFLVESWGDVRTTFGQGTGDGTMILAAKTTDLGGGMYHYEYALFNQNSHRAARLFSVPVGTATVTNIGFHDSDLDATTDWPMTLADGVLTWQTSTFAQDSLANSIDWGLMYNFRFDCSVPPMTGNSTVGLFRAGTPGELAVSTKVPTAAASVAAPATETPLTLAQNEPNPVGRTTSIRFATATSGPVSLRIYDPAGRLVRTLVDRDLEAGPHVAEWNVDDQQGHHVSPGVYYYRISAAGRVAARALVVPR